MGAVGIVKQLASKKLVRLLLYAAHETLPDKLFFTCVHLLHLCCLSRVTCCGGSNGVYRFSDGVSVRFAADRLRGLRLWYRGFGSRDKQLDVKYGLRFIDMAPGDIVIDCGSNYGDVWYALTALGAKPRYLAIEPDPNVVGVLKQNLPEDALVNEIALGARDKEFVEFFVSGMSGDSSIVQPDIIKDRVLVPMQKLDTLIDSWGLHEICLLKLEAEGYEVEILQGAQKALEFVRYVAVDGSAERGDSETLADLRSILEEHGFSMIHHSNKYVSALFGRLP